MNEHREPELLRQLPRLARRHPEGHKGDYGRVLIVAGSRGMSGAACLAGTAALRGGAGLVRVAVPAGILSVVAAYEPSYLTFPLPEDSDGLLALAALPSLERLAQANDVLAIGPGLGQGVAISEIVLQLLAAAQRPVVVDADGINAIAGHTERLASITSAVILTPHPGEFARLTGTKVASIQARRTEVAAEFARRHRAVLVLKGHRTVVTDGHKLHVNQTGNPGMATGGTGDVLTGLTAALVAQGLTPFDAAVLGTHLHGLAGDIARNELGETALIASDLLRYLPAAFRTVEIDGGTVEA